MSTNSNERTEASAVPAVPLPKSMHFERTDGPVRFWLFTFFRLSFSAVLLLGSFYSLLAYLPGTYAAVIKEPLFAWTAALPRLLPIFCTVFGVLALVAIWIEQRNTSARRLIVGFTAFLTLGIVYLYAASPLIALQNGTASYMWALAFVLPVGFVGAIDYKAHLRSGQLLSGPSALPRLRDVLLGGVFIAILSPASAYLRSWLAHTSTEKIATIALLWGALTQILLFSVLLCAAALIQRLAVQTSHPAIFRFRLFTLLFWFVAFRFLETAVAPGIAFEGYEADFYCASLALAIVLLIGGVLLRRNRLPAKPRRELTNREVASVAFFLIAGAITVPAYIGAVDWNSIFVKLWEVSLWAMLLVTILFMKRRTQREHSLIFLVTVMLASYGVYQAGTLTQKSWPALLRKPSLDVPGEVTKLAVISTSFGAARDLMGHAGKPPCGDHCQFVQANTNIRQSPDLTRSIDLVRELTPDKNPDKPNIFIFVVDSLRSDYVSAYDPAVTFTPAIGAFAADSVVFRNAFTRYNGTIMAEPAIWSGTLLLHKHYVQPFKLVNNLEKLIQADDYHSFISIDQILSQLLSPKPDTVRLDTAAKLDRQLDLCTTAKEAEQKIDARVDRERPIFLYTQPENVHILGIKQREGLDPAKKDYAPFVSNYAAALERTDACFGDFIQHLKHQGLYENSIIVLTSDHGEALGEHGEIGHGHQITAETLRIPLIIHLAKNMRSLSADTNEIAFNTDITPTLYYLLGHRPIVADPLFGRPLFTEAASEQEPYKQQHFLVEASYSPVFGVLYENGTQYFVEDESQRVESYFDLLADPHANLDILNKKRRLLGEQDIRQDLHFIDSRFDFQYHPRTFLSWLLDQ